MVLGELDCREGLQQAVEKARHADLDAAIRGIASRYTTMLEEFQRQRRLTNLWVSPVPAVMEATAVIIQSFNKLMQTQVRQDREQWPFHACWSAL